MTMRLASAFALVSLFAAPVQAELPELRTFECDATVGQAHYHLVLSRTDSGARMQVQSDGAVIADGPAISYRSGTRYFIPTDRSAGIKLTIDRDPARICFGAGGSDCHTCAAAPKPARAYAFAYDCPGDGFRLIANFTRFSYPDVIIEDERGNVVASGPGSFWGRISSYITLPIGPGESYQVEYGESMACTFTDLGSNDPSPPFSTDSSCLAGSGPNQYQFELHHVGDEAYAEYFYADGGFIIGPISKLDGGRYLLVGGRNGGVTYRQVDDSSGEICDGPSCVQCQLAVD